MNYKNIILLFKKSSSLKKWLKAFPTSTDTTKGVLQGLRGAFTLVELVVVVTILAIISTIGFASYTSHISLVRDTTRVKQISILRDNLEISRRNKLLPLPTNYIVVKAKGSSAGYNGYAGETVLKKIKLQDGGKDPEGSFYYTYYVTKDRSHFQLLTFLEEEVKDESIVKNNDFKILKQVNADDINYKERFIKVSGDRIGIMTDKLNTPLQEVASIKENGFIDLDGDDKDTKFIAYLDDKTKYYFSGSILSSKIYGLSKPNKYGAPRNCTDGFIGVPGNPDFNQEGFCVAKYEMAYKDSSIPNSSIGGSDFNSIKYIAGKTIVSMEGKFPIADISQKQAIKACKSMGDGYHLITNNEWMTISRDIELLETNWSGEVGTGSISNGVSGEPTQVCTSTTGGNPELRGYGTKTGRGSDTFCNKGRKHILSNQKEIWDLAGNLWEHVNKANTIDSSNYNSGQTSITGTSPGNNWDSDGVYPDIDMNKYGSVFGYGKTNGMGSIFGGAGGANNTFIRGGSAIDSENGGIYAINLYNREYASTYTSSRNIGFRCAY